MHSADIASVRALVLDLLLLLHFHVSSPVLFCFLVVFLNFFLSVSLSAFTTYEFLRHHLAFDPSKLSKAPSAG